MGMIDIEAESDEDDDAGFAAWCAEYTEWKQLNHVKQEIVQGDKAASSSNTAKRRVNASDI